ncbi:MAG: hypothetical protein MMC33_002368 [Icmadophila ericetorum]|nr:hypothetical protein [Icmadophila ericetorum]
MVSHSLFSLIHEVNKLVYKNVPESEVWEPSSMDPKSLQVLQRAVRKLGAALETPGDTVQRIGYLGVQQTAVRIGIDLDIFNMLADARETGKTVSELATASGADPALLVRILRYLASIDVVDQIGLDRYKGNSISKALTVRELVAGIKVEYDLCNQTVMKLPFYLAKTKYKNPENPADGPFNFGFKSEEPFFQWIMRPENLYHLPIFSDWMIGQRIGRISWLDMFPVEEQLSLGFSGEKDAVMIVDVAGASGSEMKDLKKRYPSFPGRLILQDLPQAIEQINKLTVDFETMDYNFFSPQPVIGARAYYFRQIFHDWNDEKCGEILKHTAEAMTPGYSKIIINDMVVPDIGAGVVACQLDIVMMSMLSAKERTESEWRELLDSSGYKILKIWTGDETTESVIEAMLK